MHLYFMDPAAQITGKVQIDECLQSREQAAVYRMTVGACAYRSLIQLKGCSKGVHESQVEMPSKQLVEVRCCDSIGPANSTLDAAGHDEQPEEG